MAAEYTAAAITEALTPVPGVSNLRAGELCNGDPVVHFDLDGGRAGGAGVDRDRGDCGQLSGYRIVVGVKYAGGGEPGRTAHSLQSRRVRTSADITFAVAALAQEVKPLA